MHLFFTSERVSTASVRMCTRVCVGWCTFFRAHARTYLFHQTARNVQEAEQKLQLHLRLKVGKAFLDVAQHLLVKLRTYGAVYPRVVRGAQFIMQPQ